MISGVRQSHSSALCPSLARLSVRPWRAEFTHLPSRLVRGTQVRASRSCDGRSVSHLTASVCRCIHLPDSSVLVVVRGRYTGQGVSESRWKEFPIYLTATAGMRLLPPTTRAVVLKAVRDFFRTTPFRFDSDAWARVISGEEEGACRRCQQHISPP